MEQNGQRLAPVDEAEDQRKLFEGTRTATHTDYEAESGHPCGCPLVPLAATNQVSPPIEEAKRRSRWASGPPAVSAAPPLGVNKTRRSAASSSSPTSRLRTQPPSEVGLLSIAAAKPAAMAAANPQMPAADVNLEVQASSKEEAPAVEIFLADADDRSGPVDADVAHLAEQGHAFSAALPNASCEV